MSTMLTRSFGLDYRIFVILKQVFDIAVAFINTHFYIYQKQVYILENFNSFFLCFFVITLVTELKNKGQFNIFIMNKFFHF